EYDFAARVQGRRIDDLRSRKRGFDLSNTAFDETLLLARRMVFGVFLEVAVRARFGNRGNDPRAVDGFQLLQLCAQALGTGFGHGGSLHVRDSFVADTW